jgi:hypothetical protein
MTFSGCGSLKMAVPATMTLLPECNMINDCFSLGTGKAMHTCVCTHIDRLRTNTAINFDVLLREPGAQLCDLRNAALQELLAATACVVRSQLGTAGHCNGGIADEPGYTVMTRSMSAASPTSSVIAVDGVSGDIATPAFILRVWMASMRGSGSADDNMRLVLGALGRRGTH